MKDEYKSKLDGLFAEAKEKKEVAQKKRDIEAEEQAAFLEKFMKMRDDVIIPAMKEFADYIGENGWTGELELSEERPDQYNRRGEIHKRGEAPAARLTFYRGGKRPLTHHRNELPHFSMTCAKASRVRTHKRDSQQHRNVIQVPPARRHGE